MFKIIFILLSLFSLQSYAQEKTLNSISDFSYNGISFNTKQEDLLKHGYSCDKDSCLKMNDSVKVNYFFVTETFTDSIKVFYYKDKVKQILIQNLIPYDDENCKHIIAEIKSSFERATMRTLSFGKRYPRGGPIDDLNSLNSVLSFGKDVLKINFSCSYINSMSGDKIFITSSFNYENLASRILLEDFKFD